LDGEMKIFVSHAAVDADIAQDLVTLLRLGAGVQHTDIFCSSVPGNIPNGASFINQILMKLHEAELVIAILSPAYFRSDFCKAEAGAAQVKKVAGQSIFALLVPPIDFKDLDGVLHGAQGGKILNPAALDELHDSAIVGNPHPPGTPEWNLRRANFLSSAQNFVDREISKSLIDQIVCADVKFVRDNAPNTTYKLKLNLTFRNDTGSPVDAITPSWSNRAGELPAIDKWSGVVKRQPNGSWGGHEHQVTVNAGQTFMASVAFDPASDDEELRLRHENLNIGKMMVPLRINGLDVVLERKI
jgi:TIR domain